MKKIYLLVTFLLASLNCITANSDGFQLTADSTALWGSSPTINVCWENQSDALSRQWVQEAVKYSWEINSAITFSGWGNCQPSDKGIRIQVSDTWPKVDYFGTAIDGKTNGMILNFTFQVGFSCPAPDYTHEQCIKYIAAHEFGHALGFHHEQNRSDRDTTSKCYQEKYQANIPNEILITSLDEDSIMNYCNPLWNGNGKLSALDIQGLRGIYGNPQPSKMASYLVVRPGMGTNLIIRPFDGNTFGSYRELKFSSGNDVRDWSWDGKIASYLVVRPEGKTVLYIRPFDGAKFGAVREIAFSSSDDTRGWSWDGKIASYLVVRPGGKTDLFIRPFDGVKFGVVSEIAFSSSDDTRGWDGL
jgi:hypothetical protein